MQTIGDYQAFLDRKSQLGGMSGFEPVWLPDFLFDFQKHLVEWATRKGRAAIFADCGLGKTPMQLVWAENVIRKENRPVLIVTPLAVAQQTVKEAEKFGIEAKVSRDGTVHPNITVTNYERLHYFNPQDFIGVVCDESSAIKNFDAKRTAAITEFMRITKYRQLDTATAAPNDFFELGTSSEALGFLGFRDMITHFFKQETSKDHHGWGRTKYRFRGHAQQPFWQWVCSWARSMRRPSDLGFSDSRFVLPELIETEIVVRTAKPRKGLLFTVPARDMQEERAERNYSIQERCEKAAELAMACDGPTVSWVELNPEGDLLTSMIGDCVQVKGSMSDDAKEEALDAFSRGQIKRLVTKAKIGAWGLNWQHCANINVFPSHSFEQYYQLIRRCYRFGQKSNVRVNLILCEGQCGIMENLKRKQHQTSQMFDSLVKHMNDSMHLSSLDRFNENEQVPSWLGILSVPVMRNGSSKIKPANARDAAIK